MNYGVLKTLDVADGPGIRVTLFVSGCHIHCKGCQNLCSQAFDYGQKFTSEVLQDILSAMSFDYIEGFTLCGGEPFSPENQETCYYILKEIKRSYPNKTIWCYTGYYLEFIPFTKYKDKMLNLIDVLVEGPYIEKLRDITSFNLWRGSTNQNLVDIKKTLNSNKKILWKEYN